MDYATIAFNAATYGGGVMAQGSGNYYVFSTIVSENDASFLADWRGKVTVMEDSLVNDSEGLESVDTANLVNNLFGESADLDPSHHTGGRNDPPDGACHLVRRVLSRPLTASTKRCRQPRAIDTSWTAEADAGSGANATARYCCLRVSDCHNHRNRVAV
jgi:hypothetical protein